MQLEKERYTQAARNESNKAHAKGWDGGGGATIDGCGVGGGRYAAFSHCLSDKHFQDCRK